MNELWEALIDYLRGRLEPSLVLYYVEHLILFSVCATAPAATAFSVLLLLAALRHPNFLSKQRKLPTKAALLSSLPPSTSLDQDELCGICRDAFESSYHAHRLSHCPLCRTQLYTRGPLFYILKSLVNTSRFFMKFYAYGALLELILEVALILESLYLGAEPHEPLAKLLGTAAALWFYTRGVRAEIAGHVQDADDAVDGSRDGKFGLAAVQVVMIFFFSCGIVRIRLRAVYRLTTAICTLSWTGDMVL
ncbi:uncharacterized protein MYCFIDRAFT_83261 [Pseudocercospora fijiensis CIRAD86]|uniref:Uncharacterized protein n=1 Tax=Pseudocercospora fijiensis (strain CIRAD86) TaxID=383855 RepID=M2ZYV8_PSEFD|nr:uncharacterized protein MYCFIDRAFT_83261 [Pseudocercospora fijiensis CIRAD86]EME77316.1 hypothetical protein MYCFIDRAFT_83261 [Pseudocercospora fijiensis CIRAD86]